MGKALAEAFPVCRETFAEADAALGEPLSRLCFEGPEDQLTLTENTQPAILAVSIAAYRLRAVDGHAAGVRRRPQPRRVLGERRRRHLGVRRCAARSCDAAAATCRRRCRSAPARWPRFSGLDAATVAQACEEAAQGEVVSPANLNGGGQVVIAGARDAVARAGARAKELGAQARRAAAGERALSLRADEAGRGAAGAGTARAAARAIRACRSSPTWMREPKRTASAAIDALIAQVSSPVRWEDVVRRLASEGVTTYVEVGPGTVLSGLVRRDPSRARRSRTVGEPARSRQSIEALHV